MLNLKNKKKPLESQKLKMTEKKVTKPDEKAKKETKEKIKVNN